MGEGRLDGMVFLGGLFGWLLYDLGLDGAGAWVVWDMEMMGMWYTICVKSKGIFVVWYIILPI